MPKDLQRGHPPQVQVAVLKAAKASARRGETLVEPVGACLLVGAGGQAAGCAGARRNQARCCGERRLTAAAEMAVTARAAAATRGARQAGMAVAPTRGSTSPGPRPWGPGSLWAVAGLALGALGPAGPVRSRRRARGSPCCRFSLKGGGGADPARGFPWRGGVTDRHKSRTVIPRAGVS